MSRPQLVTRDFKLSAAAARAFASVSIAYVIGTLLSLAPYWIDPALIDDDARMHLLGFYALRLPEAFADHFLSDYSLSYVPPGYRVLLGAVAPILDPHHFTKVLGAGLLVLSWTLAWRIGLRLGGSVGAAGATLLCAHSSFMLVHTFGGLHRGFGFPLVFALIWAWIERRDIALAVVLGMQALFYPPVFLVGWTASAIRMAAQPRVFLGPRKSGLAAFVLTSIASAAILLSFARVPESWGRLATLEDAAAMAEYQREGGRIKILPFQPFLSEQADNVDRGLRGSAGLWGFQELTETASTGAAENAGASESRRLLAMTFLALLALTAVVFARPFPSWAPALLLSAILVHAVALRTAFRFGEPDRALKYTVLVLVVLAWPLAWGALGRIARSNIGLGGEGGGVSRDEGGGADEWIKRIAFAGRFGLVLLLGAVFVFYGFVSVEMSAMVVDARGERPLHAAIAGIDDRAGPILVAGWPGGPIDNVPILAGREVFIDYEHAHPYYLGYYAEVRRRIEATLTLIYSIDVDVARDIRDRNGLTHLILQRGVLAADADRPKLFRPLDGFARQLDESSPVEQRIFREPPESWIVYQDADYFLVDLRALDGGGDR